MKRARLRHDASSKREAKTPHAGLPTNLGADARRVDAPSGNAVLTGIEVEIAGVR